MARRRLNKKVALIGSAVFLLVVFMLVGALLYLSRDPMKFAEDGDAALAAALSSDNEDARNLQLTEAENNYRNAVAYSKTDELKVRMFFKLAGLYTETGEWRKLLGCWSEITKIEPLNLPARYAFLKYFYVVADSGVRGTWQDVASQSDEFLRVVNDSGNGSELLAKRTAELEPEAYKTGEVHDYSLGSYLYLLRGRANLELATLGMTANPEKSLADAVSDLERVKSLDPSNSEVYRYLAQAAVQQGVIEANRGNLERKLKSKEEAVALLERGMATTGEDIDSRINLLDAKLTYVSELDGPERIKGFEALEPEFVSLTKEYGDEPKAYEALSTYYSSIIWGWSKIDDAVAAMQQAMELSRDNPEYARREAELRYGRYLQSKQPADLESAISLVEAGLTYPDAQDSEGPWRFRRRSLRMRLDGDVAFWSIEQILYPPDSISDAQKQQFLSKAETAVHDIEQLSGSGEDPQVQKWQGMLELAKSRLGLGDRKTALRKMYMTYEQLRAAGNEDAIPRLCYVLAREYAGSTESGAELEFLAMTIRADVWMRRPEILLDLADSYLDFRAWPEAERHASSYESFFGRSARSSAILARSYIGGGAYDAAEKIISAMDSADANALRLHVALARAQVVRYRRLISRREQRASIELSPEAPEAADESQSLSDEDLSSRLSQALASLENSINGLLSVDPAAVDAGALSVMCESYLRSGKVEKGKALVETYLISHANDRAAQLYSKLLAEPDTTNISPERRRALQKEVLEGISDPVEHSMSLGSFYQTTGETSLALSELRRVIEMTASTGGNAKVEAYRALAAGQIFDIALSTGDMALAEEMSSLAAQDDLDECGGSFYKARLLFAKEQYSMALSEIDRALSLRPVFGYGYLVRYRVNSALGNDNMALEDIRKAAKLRPDDKLINKMLAISLFARDQKLGENATSAQKLETGTAIERAVNLNANDIELASFYAEYISATEPKRALAIRQRLQNLAPSQGNSLLLGKMAVRLAMVEQDEATQATMLEMARTSLEEAMSYDPSDAEVLRTLAEYYTLMGEKDKAEQVLSGSADWRIQWGYYVRRGEFDKARKILDDAYAANSRDSGVLEGYVMLGEQTGDSELVKRYGGELVSLDDSMENNLTLIQSYLRVGILDEASLKLTSFMERWPNEHRALLLAAMLEQQNRRAESALNYVNRYLETDQSNAQAWQLKGELGYVLGRYDQAISDFKKSKLIDNSPAVRIWLARAYLRNSSAEDAVTELKSALASGGLSSDTAGRMLEQIYRGQRSVENLRRLYEERLQALPENVYWNIRAAGIEMQMNNVERAEQLYKTAWDSSRKQDQWDLDAFSGYLSVLLRQGKMNELNAEASKYVDSEVAPVAYYKMAEARLKLGDQERAVEYCRRAVEKAGEREAMVANVLDKMRTLLGAAEVERLCLERLAQAPDSFAENWTMFNLMKMQGQYNRAVEYIDKCIQASEPDSDRRVQSVLQKTGVLVAAYKRTSDKSYLQSAIGEYESLLQKWPNKADVLNNLAYTLADNNERLDDALSYIKRALDLMPNDPGVLDTYAYVLYQQGDYEAASEAGQSALQKYEAKGTVVPTEVYENVGRIYEKLGDNAKARGMYEQALDTGGENLPEPVKNRLNAAISRVGI